MRSPFPGMDPYLESPAYWTSFHTWFITTWCEAIAEKLPDHYDANITEQVWVTEDVDQPGKLAVGDVAVSQDPHAAPGERIATAGVATLEPVTIPVLRLDEARQPYIEILHRPDQRVVAVLELLSPANKENPGRGDYLTKGNALLQQSIHLIELDLLRRGLRLPMARPLPTGDYYYLLCRNERRFDCDVFTWPLRAALPVLPVPLVAPDADLVVDLGVAFTRAFERGRFHRRVNYREDPPGSLDDETLAWVREQAAGGTPT